MTFLKTSIEYLKGVGTARAEMLKKELGIFTFADLLFHFPYRHVDRSQIYKISDIHGEMPYIQLKGKILNFKTVGKNKGQRLVANLNDGSGRIELVWFQGAKWIRDSIKENKEYMVFGKPTEFNGSINMAHPVIDDPENLEQKKYLRIMPFYTVTERMRTKGLDTKTMMKLTNNLLTDPKFFVEENLPVSIITEQKIIARKEALLQIHFPESPEKLSQAENRLKFEELFFIQLRLLRYKLKRTQLFNGIKFEKIGENFNSFYKTKLPFQLTDAQKRVIKEIRNDVKSGRQMNRLLQGDVGSGKTVVALMCMLIAMDNGFQSCMMVPTEILAQQHFSSITKLLGELNVKVRLLTGSTSAKERKIILEGLLNGEINILIGTHAVIEKIVQFKSLGFVVIDEQHRFGVEQRSALWKKNIHPPHMLVMTATPIPRTLAMTLYGDLDVSVIDELPPGRKPVRTEHRFESNRLRVIGFMKEQIAKGRQIYIVYPLIEESEKLDFMNLMAGYENISRDFPLPQYQVSMVHGKMKPKDKDFEMERFVRGETNIMVATTVIEVGVDVPNASVMIIENAERFGLSQLHQLRGRVGRGAEQSFCILLTRFKLSSDAKKRIATMCKTNDGFEIAEMDLKLRGPGELEGTQQSGVLDLRIADIAKDQILLMNARDTAQKILNSDPNLNKPENSQLLNYFTEYSKHNKWGMIS
ncbi:MAG: ATP-dependent DNA helicase RecG [Bacteroidia bacterium]